MNTDAPRTQDTPANKDTPAEPDKRAPKAPPPRRRGADRVRLTVRERVAIGGGVILLAAAITAAAALAGSFPVVTTPPRPVPVAAATPDLICPGPQTLVAPEGAQAIPTGGRHAVSGAVTALAASRTAPRATLAPLGVRSEQTAGPNLVADPGQVGTVTVLPEEAGAHLLRAATVASGAPLLTASTQVGLATSGDLRGLTAVSCGAATAEAWLVGGSTSTGNRSRLLLANPMSLPAVVDLALLGPQGPVEAPNADGIVVPAGRQVAVALDALAPGVDQLAVHVVARSGRVAVTMFDTVLRGLVPGGADDVAPAAEPARRVVVPGVTLTAGQGAGGTAVRVAVPGTEDAVVSVTLLGPAGRVVVPGGVLAVKGGSVAEVPLGVQDGVPPGRYAAVVEADLPVTAAVRIGRGARGSESAGTEAALGRNVPPSEFAWAVATPALDGGTRRPDGQSVLVGVPAVGQVGLGAADLRLDLANTGAEQVVLPVRFANAAGALGEPVEVTVAPGRTTSRPVPAGSSAVLLPAAASVHAALTVSGTDARGPLLGVLAVAPAQQPAHGSVHSVADPRLGLDAGTAED